ncbi:MAG TPA: ADYC domain-containing protein [Kofleriaceae bacterium]|nr:ADYC domain-containing protein [Kofleriaceae bacterium]
MNKTILCISLLGTACALPIESSDSGDETVGEVGQEVVSPNGISLNGISLNGISLNGISLNGISLNGISLNGISLNGTSIAAVSTSAAPLTGASMVGSTWNATASNGSTVKLRVDKATQGTAPNADLWFYSVSYQTSSGWSPLCGLDAANTPIQAVTTAGVWAATATDAARYASSTTQFTFACRAKTIAKCVEMGYKTYKGYANQLATCVRLLRGDFCGTGTPYTVDGTTLNLFDNVGVQADTEVWYPEAEWTPNGARCVNSLNTARFDFVVSKDPKCVTPLVNKDCGFSFAPGTVLIDELPASYQTSSTATTTAVSKPPPPAH